MIVFLVPFISGTCSDVDVGMCMCVCARVLLGSSSLEGRMYVCVD